MFYLYCMNYFCLIFVFNKGVLNHEIGNINFTWKLLLIDKHILQERKFVLNQMKTDSSRYQIYRFSSVSETLKKQNSIQSDAAKKYHQFKKSASQPAYFLDKSRLKKISDIYRAVSLQKLAKSYSLHKSKSLHNSITPQKKTSFTNNVSFKKQTFMNTLNLNKGPQNNEKTRRLRLDRTNQQQNNTILALTQNGTNFFINQIQKLHEITNLTIQKAFFGQYEHFFKSLKEDCFSRKGNTSQLKSLVSKFCYLMQLCQQKIIKINQKQLKYKYDKIEIDYSNTHVELKKKTFKMQLLIKEINQLKDHNLKISKQLLDLKQQKRSFNQSQKSMKLGNNRMQIRSILQVKVNQGQTCNERASHQQNFVFRKNSTQISPKIQNKAIKQMYHHNPSPLKEDQSARQQQPQTQIQPKERLQMIKKIRDLEKKQKDLIRALLILKSDGIDVQKAFQQVLSGQMQDLDVSLSEMDSKKHKMPRHVRKIQNKDSYDADSSIVQSIDGLTARYYEGQPDEQYIFYPIKHQYKSKPLDSQMQCKLKLNFDVLYEDQSYSGDSQSQDIEQEQPPTI